MLAKPGTLPYISSKVVDLSFSFSLEARSPVNPAIVPAVVKGLDFAKFITDPRTLPPPGFCTAPFIIASLSKSLLATGLLPEAALRTLDGTAVPVAAVLPNNPPSP